jgi:flagellar basal body-associated protein FliL
MKKIIIFGGAAVALLAAVWFFVLPMLKGGGGHKAEHGTETEHAEAGEEHAPTPPPPKQQAAPPPAHEDEDEGVEPVSVKLPPFVLNLPASAGARSPYFKCTLSIVLRDEEFGKVMQSDASYQFQKAQALILDALTTLVENPDDLFVNETKQVFCDDLTDRLNEEIKRPKPSEGGGGGHGGEKKDKNAKPPPARPFKEVMILEWATQR